jgi:hypothetical protein
VSVSTTAASGSLGRLVRTELHSLLGVAGAAYGVNAHAATPMVLGIGYAVAVRLLAVVSSAVEKAAAKDTDYPVAEKVVDAAAAYIPALAPPTAPGGMQAGSP